MKYILLIDDPRGAMNPEHMCTTFLRNLQRQLSDAVTLRLVVTDGTDTGIATIDPTDIFDTPLSPVRDR
jgi:hypothetical protein